VILGFLEEENGKFHMKICESIFRLYTKYIHFYVKQYQDGVGELGIIASDF